MREGSGYPKVGCSEPNYVEDVLVLAFIKNSPPERMDEIEIYDKQNMVITGRTKI